MGKSKRNTPKPGSNRAERLAQRRATVEAEAAAVTRPFAGLAAECDLVALREFVPAATAPLSVTGEGNAVVLATVLPGPVRPAVFGGALVLALILLVCSASLPGRKLRPYWGRAVDVLETVSAVALLPLLLAVLEVYQLVHDMTGN